MRQRATRASGAAKARICAGASVQVPLCRIESAMTHSDRLVLRLFVPLHLLYVLVEPCVAAGERTRRQRAVTEGDRGTAGARQAWLVDRRCLPDAPVILRQAGKRLGRYRHVIGDLPSHEAI